MSKVLVLLSTYNGEKYLKEQLDSLQSQTYKNFEIVVRDDGSNDNTEEILKSYDLNIIESLQNVGPKLSFSFLLDYALKNFDADYFMFCDQDDIWEKDKIEKTLNAMKNLEKENLDLPIAIHSDLEVVDENLNTISKSMWQYEKLNSNMNQLNRLLVQNTITGCTMMINRKLAERSLPISKNCIMHDWWISLVASYFGKIGTLNVSTIKYRQHNNNDTGSKKFNLGYIFRKINSSKIEKYIYQAKAFLDQYEDLLDVETKKMLKDFVFIKDKSFLGKRSILLKNKILKQGFVRNIGLLLKI